MDIDTFVAHTPPPEPPEIYGTQAPANYDT